MVDNEIVLTACRSMMSEYNDNPLYGFMTCSSDQFMPHNMMFKYVCPSVPVNKDGSPVLAPLAVRRVESCLYNRGFDVGVAHPDYVERVVGPDTRVVGVTGIDPLGIGPGSTTVAYLESFFEPRDKIPYTGYKMAELMHRLKRLKQKYDFKIIFASPVSRLVVGF